AQQDRAAAANAADGRTALQNQIIRGGSQAPRPAGETMDAAMQSVFVRTSAVMAQPIAMMGTASDQDGVRYQRPVLARAGDGIAAAVLVRFDVGALQTGMGSMELQGFIGNNTRLELSIATSIAQETTSEDAGQERAAIMTTETSVKLSGAVVSAGFV